MNRKTILLLAFLAGACQVGRDHTTQSNEPLEIEISQLPQIVSQIVDRRVEFEAFLFEPSRGAMALLTTEGAGQGAIVSCRGNEQTSLPVVLRQPLRVNIMRRVAHQNSKFPLVRIQATYRPRKFTLHVGSYVDEFPAFWDDAVIVGISDRSCAFP